MASGVPDRRPDHCARIASLALDMLDALAAYEDGLGRPLKVSSKNRLLGIHFMNICKSSHVGLWPVA